MTTHNDGRHKMNGISIEIRKCKGHATKEDGKLSNAEEAAHGSPLIIFSDDGTRPAGIMITKSIIRSPSIRCS